MCKLSISPEILLRIFRVSSRDLCDYNYIMLWVTFCFGFMEFMRSLRRVHVLLTGRFTSNMLSPQSITGGDADYQQTRLGIINITAQTLIDRGITAIVSVLPEVPNPHSGEPWVPTEMLFLLLCLFFSYIVCASQE